MNFRLILLLGSLMCTSTMTKAAHDVGGVGDEFANESDDSSMDSMEYVDYVEWNLSFLTNEVTLIDALIEAPPFKGEPDGFLHYLFNCFFFEGSLDLLAVELGKEPDFIFQQIVQFAQHLERVKVLQANEADCATLSSSDQAILKFYTPAFYRLFELLSPLIPRFFAIRNSSFVTPNGANKKGLMAFEKEDVDRKGLKAFEREILEFMDRYELLDPYLVDIAQVVTNLEGCISEIDIALKKYEEKFQIKEEASGTC